MILNGKLHSKVPCLNHRWERSELHVAPQERSIGADSTAGKSCKEEFGRTLDLKLKSAVAVLRNFESKERLEC